MYNTIKILRLFPIYPTNHALIICAVFMQNSGVFLLWSFTCTLSVCLFARLWTEWTDETPKWISQFPFWNDIFSCFSISKIVLKLKVEILFLFLLLPSKLADKKQQLMDSSGFGKISDFQNETPVMKKEQNLTLVGESFRKTWLNGKELQTGTINSRQTGRKRNIHISFIQKQEKQSFLFPPAWQTRPQTKECFGQSFTKFLQKKNSQLFRLDA